MLHRAEHTAALGQAVEFIQHRGFHQIGQLINDEAALIRVLVHRQPPFLINNQLDRQRPAHRFPGRRGDRLVIGVGVQTVAVVIHRNQRLQSGADVVEIQLLRMQRTTGGLNMVFQLLRTRISSVSIAHHNRPDAPRDPPDHAVFRVHPVAEEKRQIGRERINRQAAREIALNIGEAVGQRERQLGDRVRAGFGDVITGDGHRIKIAHPMLDEILLNIAHQFQGEFGGKNAGVLPLIFF